MRGSVLSRILIVDDEPDIRAILLLCLERLAGLEVLVAESGQHALELLGGLAAAQWPDLVILDVMMGGLDGPATLDQLRKIAGGSRVPVVFLTAKNTDVVASAISDEAVIGYITKPFSPVELADQIRAMWLASGRS